MHRPTFAPLRLVLRCKPSCLSAAIFWGGRGGRFPEPDPSVVPSAAHKSSLYELRPFCLDELCVLSCHLLPSPSPTAESCTCARPTVRFRGRCPRWHGGHGMSEGRRPVAVIPDPAAFHTAQRRLPKPAPSAAAPAASPAVSGTLPQGRSAECPLRPWISSPTVLHRLCLSRLHPASSLISLGGRV